MMKGRKYLVRQAMLIIRGNFGFRNDGCGEVGKEGTRLALVFPFFM
jgi:hypothetical protein